MNYQEQLLPLDMGENDGYSCPVCKARGEKRALNKKDYQSHKPFPVRLGILKDVIHQDANERDVSIHRCLIEAIEMRYAIQLDGIAKSYNVFFDEVVSLVKAGYDLDEVTKELKIDTKLFLRGLTPDQSKTMEVLLRRSRFEQKGLFE